MPLALLAIIGAITGCATVNQYVPPTAVDAAHLAGDSRRSGLFDWQSLAITAIDDQFVATRFMGTPSATRVLVTPEPHRLVVTAAFNRQFGGGGPYEAIVTVPFAPQTYGDYKLNGKVRDNTFEVWVEDRKSGRPISEVAAAPYRAQPKATYIPVYIPPGG